MINQAWRSKDNQPFLIKTILSPTLDKEKASYRAFFNQAVLFLRSYLILSVKITDIKLIKVYTAALYSLSLIPKRKYDMTARLILSAIAPNKPGMANNIVNLIHEAGATILESHMSVMSQEFAVIMEVAGPWNALAKLEHQLPSKAPQLGMLTMLKRSEKTPEANDLTPYRVIITTLEDRGVIKALTEFFYSHQINIEELNCRTYLAPHSEETMGEIKLTVTVPSSVDIEMVRSNFVQFAESYNLDANISPLKIS